MQQQQHIPPPPQQHQHQQQIQHQHHHQQMQQQHHHQQQQALQQQQRMGGFLDASNADDAREQDRYLPVANISRIMKKTLPANAKIGKEAKEVVQECVSEFISFITSEASGKVMMEKRKTITGDDIIWAMESLGFDSYVDPMKVYLAKYRDSTKLPKEGGGSASTPGGKRGKKEDGSSASKSGRKKGGDDDDDDDDEEDEDDFDDEDE